MRFQLGDILTEGGSETAYLSDEEIEATLETYPMHWNRAKFELVNALIHRFSYEVSTKVGAMDLALDERYRHWKELHAELKAQVQAECGTPQKIPASHYFVEGMHDNHQAVGGRHRCFCDRSF